MAHHNVGNDQNATTQTTPVDISGASRSTSSWYDKAYRIRNIPPNVSQLQLCSKLQEELGIGASDIIVHSLAEDASWTTSEATLTATATFRNRPSAMPADSDNWVSNFTWSELGRPLQCLSFDTHFYGFTPLSPGDVHFVDCVAIHGWGGHALGSFRARHSLHTWLRDSLPSQFTEFCFDIRMTNLMF